MHLNQHHKVLQSVARVLSDQAIRGQAPSLLHLEEAVAPGSLRPRGLSFLLDGHSFSSKQEAVQFCAQKGVSRSEARKRVDEAYAKACSDAIARV